MRNIITGSLLTLMSTVGWAASSGTGFFVSSQGHIVSNEHVVGNCSSVDFSFGGQKHNALVLAVDKTNDIALLKTNFNNPKFLSFASNDPELLDPIIVAGYPFGDSLSSTIKVTRGVVSSLAGIDNNFSNVQIDAAIQPGNSGGPIVNDQGQVLAIAVSKLDAEYALKTFGSLPESVNFGIKGGIVKSFLSANGVRTAQGATEVDSLGRLLTQATVKLNCADRYTVTSNSQRKDKLPSANGFTGKGEVTGDRSVSHVHIGDTVSQMSAKLGGSAARIETRNGVTAYQYCENVGRTDINQVYFVVNGKVRHERDRNYIHNESGSCLTRLKPIKWSDWFNRH